MINKESKYLIFITIEIKTKTRVIEVTSKSIGNVLGVIKWFPSWRQYAFFPEINTLFNKTCLLDIVAYIGKLR